MDHEKDLHSQHVKNAVITPDPPDFGAIGSILPFSISALPATPFSPYKTSPLGYSPAKVKKQIPVIHSGFSRRQHQQIQPAELGERPVGGDHLEPRTNGKSGQISIHPQFR